VNRPAPGFIPPVGMAKKISKVLLSVNKQKRKKKRINELKREIIHFFIV
jgi:hypothetical protein